MTGMMIEIELCTALALDLTTGPIGSRDVIGVAMGTKADEGKPGDIPPGPEVRAWEAVVGDGILMVKEAGEAVSRAPDDPDDRDSRLRDWVDNELSAEVRVEFAAWLPELWDDMLPIGRLADVPVDVAIPEFAKNESDKVTFVKNELSDAPFELEIWIGLLEIWDWDCEDSDTLRAPLDVVLAVLLTEPRDWDCEESEPLEALV